MQVLPQVLRRLVADRLGIQNPVVVDPDLLSTGVPPTTVRLDDQSDVRPAPVDESRSIDRAGQWVLVPGRRSPARSIAASSRRSSSECGIESPGPRSSSTSSILRTPGLPLRRTRSSTIAKSATSKRCPTIADSMSRRSRVMVMPTGQVHRRPRNGGDEEPIKGHDVGRDQVDLAAPRDPRWRVPAVIGDQQREVREVERLLQAVETAGGVKLRAGSPCLRATWLPRASSSGPSAHRRTHRRPATPCSNDQPTGVGRSSAASFPPAAPALARSGRAVPRRAARRPNPLDLPRRKRWRASECVSPGTTTRSILRTCDHRFGGDLSSEPDGS